MSPPENFSQRLKTARSRLGLTQELFAPMLTISRNYLNMLEGGRKPSAKLLDLFDRMERRGAFDARVIESAAPYHAAPAGGPASLLHQCQGLLEALHNARTLEEMRFGIDSFERVWRRFKEALVNDSACAPTKNSAASTITAPPSPPQQTEAANIVKLPKQHLISRESSSAPSKTRRG